MSLFTLAFWKTALEHAAVTFAATFAGSLVILTTPTLKGVEAAAIGAATGALYAFVKQLGGVQSANATTKVATPKAPAA